MFSRTKNRNSTYAILSNIQAFHHRLKKMSSDEFWKEIDRSISTTTFRSVKS